MTLTYDKNVHTGIAVSLMVHGLLLLLLMGGLGANMAQKWIHEAALAKEKEKEREKEVVLMFPDQLLPPEEEAEAPQPKKYFMRTTQSEAQEAAPTKSDFISDRNTKASSKLGPSPDGVLNMPTTHGVPQRMNELANRDFKDGSTAEDAASVAAVAPVAPSPPPPPVPPVLQMRTPDQEPPLPSMVQPPPTSPMPPAEQVAKVDPAQTALTKMMEEMDKDSAKADPDRLPLEVKRAESRADTPQPPKEVAAMPDVPADPNLSRTPPPVGSVTMKESAGKPKEDVFSPTTRTSEMRGTISNRGDVDAVDAEQTPMGIYYNSVINAVGKKWHLYYLMNRDAILPGEIKVQFFINKQGKAEELRVTTPPGAADPRLIDFTLRAIKDAEKPPIPADLLPMLEQERVPVEYKVLIY